jgi:hypothetical protein
MLIGIIGPFGVGKTTFLKNSMDWLSDHCRYNLTVVLADLESEYHYNVNDNCWDLTKNFKRWKGHREEKMAEPWLEDMIWDSTRLWIVESARYFKGLQPNIIEAHKKWGGGVRFIVAHAKGGTLMQFLRERTASHNKVPSDYWTPETCLRESNEHVNSANNRYIPAGIPCVLQQITEHRVEWEIIKGGLFGWMNATMGEWYPRRKHESHTNQRSRRIGQDYIDEAIGISE